MNRDVVRRVKLRVADPAARTAAEYAAGKTGRHQGALRLKGSPPAMVAVMAKVTQIAGVAIEQDVIEIAPGAPRQPGAPVGLRYPDPRALLRIDPDRAAPGSLGGAAPVRVAVVDSGLMVDHPDLRGHVWTGRVNGQTAHGARCIGGSIGADVTDEDGHGTMLAGAILATADRAPGLTLMPVKFFDGATLPRSENAAAAITFAVENEATIINLSWDLGLGSRELEESIRYACARGTLIVVAAGNNGADNDRYRSVPACYAEVCPEAVITVMATNRYDEKASFSNYGRKTVDLAAPGVGVASTRRFIRAGNGSRTYGAFKGTSVAAAQVTGAAALLKSRKPALTASELKDCLVRSVDPLGLKCVTGGRLNLSKALSRC